MATTENLLPVPGLVDDPRVYVFRRLFKAPPDFEELQVDAYILVSERYVLVCDTLLCPKDVAVMLEAVRDELVGRQVLVVNSHADWDHCWGNSYFRSVLRAPIIAHEEGVKRLRSAEAKAGLLEYQQRFPIFHDVELTPATITFERRMRIYGGDLTFELLHAPGHCPDHCVLWVPEIRLLLAFDAIEKPFSSLYDAQSVPAMFATLEHLQTLHPHQVLYSHGQTGHGPIIAENLRYFREMELRCRTFLAAQQLQHDIPEQPSVLVDYPFDRVIAGSTELADPAYYREAHEHNIAAMLAWLMPAVSSGE